MYAPRPKPPSKSREQVMNAVHELLQEGSFHTSTVEEVAARAGVSRATLYQHFGSRLGLVDAICETFDATPALIAVRAATDVDTFLERVVDFWSDEEQALVQLYGAAAVDPAAQSFVERQRRDRYGEVRRVLGKNRAGFPALAMLTSFETYLELRRHASLSKRDVVRSLQAAAAKLVR